jgi:hypothetical protein
MGVSFHAKGIPSECEYESGWAGIVKWQLAIADAIDKEKAMLYFAWASGTTYTETVDGRTIGTYLLYECDDEEALRRLGFTNLRWRCKVGPFAEHYEADHDVKTLADEVERTFGKFAPILAMDDHGSWSPKVCKELADGLDQLPIPEVLGNNYLTDGRIETFDVNERMKSAMHWCQRHRRSLRWA